MDPLENSGKITPSPSYRMTTVIALVIIGLQIAIAAATYPFLPPIVPTHWDAAGNVNGYMPKLLNAVFIPLLSIGLFLLLRFVSSISPRLSDQDPRAAQKIVGLLLTGILLFMLIIQVVVFAIQLGVAINIVFVVNLAVSALFIFIGNYLGKVRRNFWIGIRTPWTLASDVVWERTHRLGGWLFVAAGVFGIVTTFIPSFRIWGVVGSIILVSMIVVMYSYIVYRQVETSGKNPLSPPFNDI